MTKYLKTFAFYFTILSVITTIIAVVISVYAGIELGLAGSIATVLASIYITAYNYAKIERAKPRSRYSWKFSALATILMIIISAIITVAYELISKYIFGISLFSELSSIPFVYFVIGAVFVFILYGLLTRLVFPNFVKVNLKKIAKHEGKK
ncbi:MAG: hypothetical protein COC17_03360 [Hyphomicrobiales bacterium]|nr:ABZJ_00895 family protein [Hyphomicrobiales bacterium]PCH50950.1 MAG: hypothetical protein COC17_03360 [Hyphomicrobiales bacterium]